MKKKRPIFLFVSKLSLKYAKKKIYQFSRQHFDCRLFFGLNVPVTTAVFLYFSRLLVCNSHNIFKNEQTFIQFGNGMPRLVGLQTIMRYGFSHNVRAHIVRRNLNLIFRHVADSRILFSHFWNVYVLFLLSSNLYFVR